MSSEPSRYRVVREVRAEHVLSLPATVPDADALLHAARTALHDAGRSTSEARLDARGGQLVVSYLVDPDHAHRETNSPRRKVGFQ